MFIYVFVASLKLSNHRKKINIVSSSMLKNAYRRNFNEQLWIFICLCIEVQQFKG